MRRKTADFEGAPIGRFLGVLLGASLTILAQSADRPPADSLIVQYRFWSAAEFKGREGAFEPVCSFGSFGKIRPEFQGFFADNPEGFALTRRAQAKYMAGNCACMIPAVIGAGIALFGLPGRRAESSIRIAALGGALCCCVVDICLGRSAFRDLRTAASRHNTSVYRR
jgi:hypothetical protein